MPMTAMPTTAKALIYALGGGHGHARRGLLLQQRLAERGVASAVLLCPGADRHFTADNGPRHYAQSLADAHLAPLFCHPPPHWIVDTFPQGWRGEITAQWLARFEKTTWIARYAKNLRRGPGDPSDLPAYTQTLLPYPESHNEWERPLPDARPTGYMIDASHWRLSSDSRGFAVLDPGRRCGRQVLSVFARLARQIGLGFQYWQDFGQPLSAGKWLVVGAGYHTFYELLGLGVDVRFLPIKKRHDDQFRRASLFGLALTHLDQILPWLDSPPPAPIPYTPPDWPAVLRHLEA